MAKRVVFITPKQHAGDLEKALGKSLEWKRIREDQGLLLYVAEGKGIPDLGTSEVLLLGIDDRGPDWLVRGNLELAKPFNAKVELTVGFEIEMKDYKKLKKDKAFSAAIKQIEGVAGEIYCDDDNERFGTRIDVDVGENGRVVLEALETLAGVFQSKNIPYRVTLFRDQTGVAVGDLGEGDEYLGPAAYVRASWDVEVMRTETVELVLNESESLLDGAAIEGL